MQIFVDADACPVVGIVEKVAKEHSVPVTLLCDTNHVLSSDYSEDKMWDTEILEADRKGEESFKKLISVSSQFFGWLTGVGSGMRIVGPEDVK